MKEPAKDPVGLGGYLNLNFFWRTVGLYYAWVFDFLITMRSQYNRDFDLLITVLGIETGNLCVITMAINFDTRINPWPPGGLAQFVIPARTLVKTVFLPAQPDHGHQNETTPKKP
jgi:hypothetical protein